MKTNPSLGAILFGLRSLLSTNRSAQLQLCALVKQRHAELELRAPSDSRARFANARSWILALGLTGLAWSAEVGTVSCLAVEPEIAIEQPPGTDIPNFGSQDFGGVNVGVSSNLIFTITNSGSADLTGLAITTNGLHPGDFIVGAPGAVTLAPGDSTTFTVTFTPAATGTRSAAIHIASDDADENPFDIDLTGTGTYFTACPGLITATNDFGANTALVNFVVEAAGDPTPTVTCTFNGSPITSPYAFPIGYNSVECVASSPAGTDTCNFTVVVFADRPHYLVTFRGFVTVDWGAVEVRYSPLGNAGLGAITVVPAGYTFDPTLNTIHPTLPADRTQLVGTVNSQLDVTRTFTLSKGAKVQIKGIHPPEEN